MELDITIVFGEGPVKPLMFAGELDEFQQESWMEFTIDPAFRPEPEFRVIQGRLLPGRTIDSIDMRKPADEEIAIRTLQQRSGRLSLRRIGRMNALAAGTVLTAGISKRVLLTGGPTIPKWFSPGLSQWPSEAELMADVVRRNFGREYRMRFDQDIDEALIIEPAATNTLQNIVYSINKVPALRSEQTRVGLLTAWHHLERCAHIAGLFGLNVSAEGKLSSQDVLSRRLTATYGPHRRQNIRNWLHISMDPHRSSWLGNTLRAERRYMRGLSESAFISYWFGYVFELDDPELIQQIVGQVLSDPNSTAALQRTLRPLGLSVEELGSTDFARLRKKDFEAYLNERTRYAAIVSHRELPPIY